MTQQIVVGGDAVSVYRTKFNANDTELYSGILTNATGLTAGTTQTQAGGLALTVARNDVTTVANDNDAVTLITAAAGLKQVVYNNGANILQVFPATSDNLGEGVDASTTIDPGQFGVFTAKDSTNWISVISQLSLGGITVKMSGGGSVISTGLLEISLEAHYSGTITSATLMADQSGSLVIDIWKDTYANYPPTVADTITAAAKPTLSTAIKSQDTTLTGWTTAITKGDILRFNVDSATTVTWATLTLNITKL